MTSRGAGAGNVLSALGKPFAVFASALPNRCTLFISQVWRKKELARSHTGGQWCSLDLNPKARGMGNGEGRWPCCPLPWDIHMVV